METNYSPLGPAFLLSLCLAPVAAHTNAPATPVARHPEVAAAFRVLDTWIKATVARCEQPGLCPERGQSDRKSHHISSNRVPKNERLDPIQRHAARGAARRRATYPRRPCARW